MLLPNVGIACKFTFQPRFAFHDGIYIVQQIMPFAQAVKENVDFVESLYTPAGLTRTDYGSEWTTYKDDDVLKLQSVVDASVIVFAPSLVLANIPDPMIGCYEDYVITIRVGVFDSIEKFRWLIDDLNLMAAAATGTQEAVNILSVDKKWITKAEYNVLEIDRNNRKSNQPTIYSLLQQQIAVNDKLKTLIRYYEDTLRAYDAARTEG